MNIAFIGLGTFGQAIASLVEYNGLDYDYAEASEGRLLSRPADIAFIMVPTQFIRQALQDNKQFVTDRTVIVNAAKGIEEKTHLMPHQIVRSISRYPYYYSLIGPSFAEGVRERHPTVVSLGYKKPEYVGSVKKILETPHFQVRESRGYRALELASALKNLYAILCGYAEGLGLGPNTQAQIITLALGEFRTLAKAMRFADYDVMAPGVVGDLVLTCGSEQSRNYKYGLRLAQERNYGAAKASEGGPGLETVEGYYTSHSINAIARRYGVNLPLARLTARVINKEGIDGETFGRFLAGYKL